MFQASHLFMADAPCLSLAARFEQLCQHYDVDEQHYLEQLVTLLPTDDMDAISHHAQALVQSVRQQHHSGLRSGIEALLQQYHLATHEGIILMCLAEALLRIPDAATADALIEDKFADANWQPYLQGSQSLWVNASTWGLMLTGKVIRLDHPQGDQPATLLAKLVNRVGEPLIRQAMYTAMGLIGRQFVLGQTIEQALQHSQQARQQGYCHSYDMLGEAALTQADAEAYFHQYQHAIITLGQAPMDNSNAPRPTISLKLSALHPRYAPTQQQRVMTELGATLVQLVQLARQHGIGVIIDAEEADRLELSLALFEQLYRHPCCQDWGQLGLAVQAYSKRALPQLAWLNTLAAEVGSEIPIRLVKGAYWDSEIKWSQQAGLADFPVFTRKAGTDVSYLLCARYLLSNATQGHLYPQFASHNAHTLAAIMAMAKTRPFELQRLYGMGQHLFEAIKAEQPKLPLRIYAPVGAHQQLLPYLVRRLLENGANNSFVHQLLEPGANLALLTQHPRITLEAAGAFRNPHIRSPTALFAARRNSMGINLNSHAQLKPLVRALANFASSQWHATPLVAHNDNTWSQPKTCVSPQQQRPIGSAQWAKVCHIEPTLISATAAFQRWDRTVIEQRVQALQQWAELLELYHAELIQLCCQEAGKTLPDGIDEVREAVDFCRYYAVAGERLFSPNAPLPGPSGERNLLFNRGRGVFVCISPWNFPLAIFVGQVAAALICGNSVIAKPAEQTPLVAYRATQLAHQAGIPPAALQLLLGSGAELGSVLCADPRVAGVCFTGSLATAHQINHTLANRSRHDPYQAIVPLLAETGGQNAMIVDSSALPEQVIHDVIHSAFQSAGQRCSALRVLFIQQEIAPNLLTLLAGAMAELCLGDPALLSSDIGPVIDADAQTRLLQHIETLCQQGARLIAQTPVPEVCKSGYFVPPTALQIEQLSQLPDEHFGPILHVISYQPSNLAEVVKQINDSGYGLTLGIHSRNVHMAQWLAQAVNVGNVYINRNQIGAVVGVQPFGGQGLSGTGPKAGGPLYLTRFISEKTITTNTSAIGGDPALLSLEDGAETPPLAANDDNKKPPVGGLFTASVSLSDDKPETGHEPRE